jgi:hypothetical protein
VELIRKLCEYEPGEQVIRLNQANQLTNMTITKTSAGLIFILFLSIPALAQVRDPNDTYYQTGKIQPLMATYQADRGSLSRFYVVANSPERRLRFKKFYGDYSKQLQQLDFDKMIASDKVDYILFDRGLNNELRLLDVEEKEYQQIAKYVPFADSIYVIEKMRRRGEVIEAQRMAKLLANISQQVAASAKSLKAEGNMDKALSARAENTVAGLRAALKMVYDFFYGYDPAFTWWVPQPYKDLDSALNAYAQLLRSKISKEVMVKDDGSGIIGNPIGNEELIRQLQYEMIPYTPDELVNIANKEFAWCDAEMLKASREMGFGDDWKKALEKVKNSYVPEGKQPQMLLGLYNESVDFLKKNDLLNIPPLAEETWRMMMMSPERQLVAPFFLGGETLLISYPTNTMEQDAKMMSLRGNNPHFSRAVLHHELIAGHHLQGFMNNRYKSYRNFSTPFRPSSPGFYE